MLAVRHRSSLVPTSIPLAWVKSDRALPNSVGSEYRLDFTRIRFEWQTKRFSFSITKENHSLRGSKISRSLSKIRPPKYTQVTGPQSKAFVGLDRFDESEYTFDAVFLRDACSCERCVDPSTTQKTFDSADIPYDIRPKSLERDDDGTVRILWEPDIPGFEGHVSVYRPLFHLTNRNLRSRLVSTSSMLERPILWDSKRMSERQLTVDYADYMSSSSVLLSSLHHLFRFGLLFIHSIPFDTDAVSHIARRIGPVKETLYGSTWDVRSVPSAKNVAYTSSHLGFHMDLLYVDNPPGLQVLHCLKSSTEGGESLFSDTLRAVDIIRRTRTDHYSALKTFPVTYHYHNNNEWYQQTRPHIETSTSPHESHWLAHPEKLAVKPSIKAINWSPPFQAPFLCNIGGRAPPASQSIKHDSSMQLFNEDQSREFRRYLDSIRHFKGLMEADEAIFEQKLQPGTAVVFDNRRIVHARRAFKDQGGERWLRGAYVDTDAFRSRMRILREEMG